MIRKISAHYVFPINRPPVKFGIICFSETGEIVEVIDNNGSFKEIASLEFFDGILVPGFVPLTDETDRFIFESLKTRIIQNPSLSLEKELHELTLSNAKSLNCEHTFGSFEKHKFPGINLINPVDFTSMRLTAHSQLRTIIPKGHP